MDVRRSPAVSRASARRVAAVVLLLGAGAAARVGLMAWSDSRDRAVLAVGARDAVADHRSADSGDRAHTTDADLAPPAEPLAVSAPAAVRLDAKVAERNARGAAGLRTTTATPGETIVERHGRVVLVDLKGHERDIANGTLDVFYWRGSYGDTESGVEVVDGRFTLQVPSLAKTVDVQRAEFDDAPAWVEARDLPLDGTNDLVIHARMRRATRLIVLADESGAPLDDVTVLDAERADEEVAVFAGEPAVGARRVRVPGTAHRPRRAGRGRSGAAE